MGHIYFQAPPKVEMVYPAILYFEQSDAVLYADNVKYLRHKVYRITLIDYDPDSPIKEDIVNLPNCSFESAYTADNLNHFVYNLYF